MNPTTPNTVERPPRQTVPLPLVSGPPRPTDEPNEPFGGLIAYYYDGIRQPFYVIIRYQSRPGYYICDQNVFNFSNRLFQAQYKYLEFMDTKQAVPRDYISTKRTDTFLNPHYRFVIMVEANGTVPVEGAWLKVTDVDASTTKMYTYEKDEPESYHYKILNETLVDPKNRDLFTYFEPNMTYQVKRLGSRMYNGITEHWLHFYRWNDADWPEDNVINGVWLPEHVIQRRMRRN